MANNYYKDTVIDELEELGYYNNTYLNQGLNVYTSFNQDYQKVVEKVLVNILRIVKSKPRVSLLNHIPVKSLLLSAVKTMPAHNSIVPLKLIDKSAVQSNLCYTTWR